MAFVVLVAVGADYNMLFVSRMRDESPHSVRYGVIRNLSSTGGVITATGLIFAASMWGLLFSSISTVVQAGFVIGIGILLDTFLVRTINGARNGYAGRTGKLVAVPTEISAVAVTATCRACGARTGSGGRVTGVGLKRLLAGVTTLVTVSATGHFGIGIATADESPADGAAGNGTAYAVGAHTLRLSPTTSTSAAKVGNGSRT